MKIITTVSELQETLQNLARKKISLVPTMGNLHQGHLSLVHSAQNRSDIVFVSIFVNPIQFGVNEDFSSYPRTLEADIAVLNELNVDYLFAPTTEELYPVAQTYLIQPDKQIDGMLEGAIRPGHFAGVATVVAKLFNLVQPQLAFFGKKDYQQLHIIKNLVTQLAMPIEVVGEEIVRASDGLALSSRNNYLSPEERKIAPRLYAELQQLRHNIIKSTVTLSVLQELCAAAMNRLDVEGWVTDYISVHRRSDLQIPEPIKGVINFKEQPLVILAASKLGRTRLLDNIEI